MHLTNVMKACTIISKVNAPTNRTCFSSGLIQVNEHPRYSFSVAHHGSVLQSTNNVFYLGAGYMYDLANSHELPSWYWIFAISSIHKNLQVPRESEYWRSPTRRLQSQQSVHLKHVYLTKSSQDPQRTNRLTNIIEYKGFILTEISAVRYSFFSKNGDFSLLQLSVEILGLATLIQVMHLPERGTWQNIIPKSDSTSHRGSWATSQGCCSWRQG